MKKKFKLRGPLKAALEAGGVTDVTTMDQVTDRATRRPRLELVNPQRRVLRALLSLPKAAQVAALEMLQKDAQAAKEKREQDNKMLENG